MPDERILSAEDIHRGIAAMGQQISGDYGDAEITVLCVLKGGMVFCSHLLTQITSPVSLDYIDVTRYGNALQANDLHIKAEPSSDLSGRQVLIVDDMIDEGETLRFVQAYCRSKGAASVKTAVLLDKIHDRKINPPVSVDYCAFTIPDHWVYGFGIDRQGLCRNLPDIYALKD